MSKNLDLPAIFVLIFLPIILLALGSMYVINHQLGWFEILLFMSGYYISTITVGVGLHRLWSHASYKTNKYVEFVLSLLAAGTLQGPILSWASNHFKHHTYTDTEKDPHTPLKYENRIKGFFWSHMGWMMFGGGSYKSIDRVTMVKLGKNQILRWQLKYYWQLAVIMNTIVPAFVGYVFGGNMLSAYAGFIFIGLGRALQQQVTFFVNSLCHFVGKKPYAKCTSGDVWWLMLLLLGENWHNFHHAFPSDYRNGAKWYQADVHKWIIYLMSKLGLAWDLKRTTKVRVEAKTSQTMEQFTELRKKQLQLMKSKADELMALYQQKIVEIDNLSLDVKTKFHRHLYKHFSNAQYVLNNLVVHLNSQIKNFENPSERLVSVVSKKLKKAEAEMQKIYEKMEQVKLFAR